MLDRAEPAREGANRDRSASPSYLRCNNRLYQRALEIAKRPQEEVIRDLKEEVPVDQKRRILTDVRTLVCASFLSFSLYGYSYTELCTVGTAPHIDRYKIALLLLQ